MWPSTVLVCLNIRLLRQKRVRLIGKHYISPINLKVPTNENYTDTNEQLTDTDFVSLLPYYPTCQAWSLLEELVLLPLILFIKSIYLPPLRSNPETFHQSGADFQRFKVKIDSRQKTDFVKKNHSSMLALHAQSILLDHTCQYTFFCKKII